MMRLFVVGLAILSMVGCEQQPDPQLLALQQENQRLKQEQLDQQAQMQKQLADDRAAMQASVDALRQEMADLKAAEAKAAEIATDPKKVSAAVAPGSAVDQSGTIDSNPTSLAPSQSPDEIKYAPGWVAEVFPLKCWNGCERTGEPSLGAFVVPGSPIKLLSHRKHIQAMNHVAYQLQGYFYAKSAGRHDFMLELSSNSSVQVCAFSFKAEDRQVITGELSVGGRERRAKSASLQLEPGLYAIQMDIDCVRDLDDKHEVLFQVRAPGASAYLPVADDDILHLKRE